MLKWIVPLLFTGLLCADESADQPSHLPGVFEVQGRVGAQYNVSSKFRSIYGNWSPVYQMELSSGNWKGLYGWFNGGWTGSHGHTEGLHSRTRVSIIPLGTGLKYAFYENRYTFLYIGGGAALSHIFIHNHSPYVQEHVKKWHWGAVAKSGARFFTSSGTFFELFVDYNYLPFCFSKGSCTDVGGLLLGASFGWGL